MAAQVLPKSRDDELIASAALQAAAARRPGASGASDGSSQPPSLSEPAELLSSDDSDAIPGYRIVGERQRGGQGIVYEAFQRATRRRVAIKVLHERQLGGASRARFEREIEILAQLRHPNIVTIHDSSRTDRRLFFVMDYIDGVPFDEFAAGVRDRDAGEILRVFVKICDAVQAAHLRGVMHRDLKPGNILVDSAGEPRVLDFGLAKWLDSSDVTAAPEMTMTGQFLGSLLWASPEQIEGAHDRLDIRCDVYSLGVILCHALTGRLPYPPPATLADAARHIRETEPLRPGSLRAGLNDELDTIILKCLQKDPQRRYQTAGELGRDVQRYLAHEPIEAKRDSVVYFLRKRLRQHRSATVVGVGILAVALIGLGFSLAFWRQAEMQGERAERRFAEVRGLAQTALFDVHDRIVDVPGTLAARKFLVENATAYLDRLAAETEDSPALLRELANGYVRVGTMQGNPTRGNLGDTDGALRSYSRAQELLTGLLRRDAGNTDVRRELASLFLYTGNVETVRGNNAAARAAYERYLAEAETVHSSTRSSIDMREVANGHGAVAEMLAAEGRSDEALAGFRKALEMLDSLEGDATVAAKLLRDRCRFARCMGDIHFDRQDFPAARSAFETSLQFANQRLTLRPDSLDARNLAAIASGRVGHVLTRLTPDDSPLPHLMRSVELTRANADADRADAQAQADLAGTLRSVLDFYLFRWQSAGDQPGRRRYLVAAIEWAERIRDFWAELEKAEKVLPLDAKSPAEYVAFVEMLRGKLAELESDAESAARTDDPPR